MNFMTYTDFLAQNNGKPVEVVDPTNLDQCFDLAVAWCMAMGLPSSIFNGCLYAKQIWTPSTTLAVQKFNYIDNTPTNVPQQGDIIVWSGYYQSWWGGGAGHTGIATGNGDVNTFECFEQNDPTGTYSHLRWYNYNCVLGWLRLKPQVVLTDTQKVAQIKTWANSTIADSDFRYKVKTLLI
jgi:hypothetical protein